MNNDSDHKISATQHHQDSDRRSDSIFGFSGSDRRDGRAESRGQDDDRQRERGFGSDDYNKGLPMDETSRLIASNKVEGTEVFGRDGKKLGTIHNFMVDKRSGRVEYAVMMHGGFLGMGERYYPLPWQTLTYDTGCGGYYIDMTENELKNAPNFDRDSEPQFNESYGKHVHDHYGLRY